MEKMSLLEKIIYLRNFYKVLSRRARESYEEIKTGERTGAVVMSDEEELVLRDTQAENYGNFSSILNNIVNEHLGTTALGELVWVEVLKPFGYYVEDHPVGEVMQVDVAHVNDLVKDGYTKIVINNMGENKPVDRDLDDLDPFESQIAEVQPSEE